MRLSGSSAAWVLTGAVEKAGRERKSEHLGSTEHQLPAIEPTYGEKIILSGKNRTRQSGTYYNLSWQPTIFSELPSPPDRVPLTREGRGMTSNLLSPLRTNFSYTHSLWIFNIRRRGPDGGDKIDQRAPKLLVGFRGGLIATYLEKATK